MTFFLLSLGGFPPTAGFIAKWYVFSAAIGAGYYGLAIIGVLSSVVSVFFYLRIVVMMYMTERDARPVPPLISALAFAGLVLSLIGVLYLGVLPARVIDSRRRRSAPSSRHTNLARKHRTTETRKHRNPLIGYSVFLCFRVSV